MASAWLLDRRPEYGTILRILDTFRTSLEPNDTKKVWDPAGAWNSHTLGTPVGCHAWCHCPVHPEPKEDPCRHARFPRLLIDTQRWLACWMLFGQFRPRHRVPYND